MREFWNKQTCVIYFPILAAPIICELNPESRKEVSRERARARAFSERNLVI
jgi:hypothetical protein